VLTINLCNLLVTEFDCLSMSEQVVLYLSAEDDTCFYSWYDMLCCWQIVMDNSAPGQSLVACMACVRVYKVSLCDASMPTVRSNEANFTQHVLPCTDVGSVS